jgi:hypothetical protein
VAAYLLLLEPRCFVAIWCRSADLIYVP